MPSSFHTLCHENTLRLAWGKVKSKDAAGGIDGITLAEFEKSWHKELATLSEELRSGQWKPMPYLEIEVAKTKHPDEKRRLGMTSIRDKIVQQAIKIVIEPRLDHLFLGNSYGFRPGKSPLKAIRRLLAECRKSQYNYVLRADVDDFFDNIDHTILQQRLIAVGIDGEIVRYIMLCLEMGKVRQGSAKWNDSFLGVPQGAPLSPLLANLYLHSFDQFAVSRGVPYIRYADDFLYLCESEVIVQRGKDWVNIYPLCTECYARIQYIPDVLAKIPDKIIVI